MLKINKINLKKTFFLRFWGWCLKTSVCVSKFHIDSLTALMLGVGISSQASCCLQQEILPTTSIYWVKQNVSYCSCAFLGMLSICCSCCPSVMISGTDRAIVLPESHCAVPPLQLPHPHCDPPVPSHAKSHVLLSLDLEEEGLKSISLSLSLSHIYIFLETEIQLPRIQRKKNVLKWYSRI